MADKIILGIHGLRNKVDPDTLKKWWSKAIAEGLRRNCGFESRFNFELAYWADIRNQAPISVAEEDEPYQESAGEDALSRYKRGWPKDVRDFLQKYAGKVADFQKDFFNLGIIEGIMDDEFEDLSAYFSDQEKKAEMQGRLLNILDANKGKGILLFSHSMGSVIAYEVLRGNEDREQLIVDHFVTAGSPNGFAAVKNKIRRGGETRTPANVLAWTNFSDPGDKVCFDCTLADDYAAANRVKVQDTLVHNEYVSPQGKANNHKSYGYLRAPEVSDLIRNFLSS
jgi:hypothetical protein